MKNPETCYQTARTKHHCILKVIKHDTSRHSHRWLGGTIKTRWAGTERLNVWVWFDWPDIEWNGHHGVEDDDVSPEAEEASVGGALVFAVVQIPGVGADLFVPEGVTDGQACRHQDQQCKDLRGGRTKKTDIQYNRAMSWMANNSVMKCSWAHVEPSFRWCPFHTKSSHHHLLQMNPSTCGMFRCFFEHSTSLSLPLCQLVKNVSLPSDCTFYPVPAPLESVFGVCVWWEDERWQDTTITHVKMSDLLCKPCSSSARRFWSSWTSSSHRSSWFWCRLLWRHITQWWRLAIAISHY